MENQSLKILIIDDSEDDIELYSMLLHKILQNPNIDSCRSSDEGKQTLQKSKYDLMLVDYNMPGTNGLDFVRSINPTKLGTAIIALTGQGNESVAVEFMRLGVCDYMQKDEITKDSLSYAINRAMEHSYIRKIEYEKNLELSRFAHTITHDINAPLGRIEAYSRLLSKHNPEKNKKYIGDIQEDVIYIREFLNKLLQFAEFGRVNVLKKQLNLGEVIQKSINNLEVEIKKSGATINVKSMPEIYGHNTSLIQLFQNLIANSMKYCSKKPVIDINYTEENNENIILISDNGIGVSKEEARTAFEPFVRIYNDLEASGMGLGLALCKAIIDEHSGTITMEPGKKEGTIIKITFPKIL